MIFLHGHNIIVHLRYTMLADCIEMDFNMSMIVVPIPLTKSAIE